MSLESFYGGKQGVSPVIKASFKYIDTDDPAYVYAFNQGKTAAKLKPLTMDECFKDINYKNVWYGELCIIDTDSKTNPNNGKLYRRTLQRENVLNNNDTSYAEYIGQIVGPSGGVPNIKFGSLDSIRKEAIGYNGESYDTNASQWNYSYPVDNDGTITISQNSPIDNNSTTNDYENIAILNSGANNITLVPGKDSNNVFHDNIQYTWCNVQKTNEDGNETNNAWLYLGFEIPYTVFDIRAVSQDYTYNGSYVDDNQTVENIEHPFYHELTFNIPRGTRGVNLIGVYPVKGTIDNPNNVTILMYENESVYNSFNDAVEYNSNTDTYTIKTDGTKYTIPVNQSKYSCLIGKWIIYNPRTTDFITFYSYLGPYKEIYNIKIEEEIQNDNTKKSILKIYYSDNSSSSLDFPYIDNIFIDSNYIFNYHISTENDAHQILNEEGAPLQLHYPEELKIEDGFLKVHWNTKQPGVWDGLGLVKTVSTLGIALTLINPTNQTSFNSLDEVLDLLNPSNIPEDGLCYTKTNNEDTVIASVATTGEIFADGEDKTGQLLAASILENNTENVALFYYNAGWKFAGYIAGTNSEIDNRILIGDRMQYNKTGIITFTTDTSFPSDNFTELKIW